MSDVQQVPAVTAPDPARLALEALWDVILATRGDADDLDVLILAVVARASVAPVTRSPALEHAYATWAAVPPDTLRRPITINALASSLMQPFETIRRRVLRMSVLGELQITPRGVVQPAAVALSIHRHAPAMARHDRVRRLYWELLRSGAADVLPRAPNVAPAFGEAPVRLVDRIVADWALRRIADVGQFVGDLLSVLLLIDLTVNAKVAPCAGATEIANRLDLPRNTVRRRLLSLVDQGFVVQRDWSYSISPSAEHLVCDEARATPQLRRMFVRLADLGVVSWWNEREGTAS